MDAAELPPDGAGELPAFAAGQLEDTFELLGSDAEARDYLEVLIDRLERDAPAALADLRVAIERDAPEEMAHVAHRLKTRCASIGLEAARDLAAQLEQRGRAVERIEVRPALVALAALDRSITTGLAAARSACARLERRDV
ncbi:MAG: Hpt domain-containing protein [Planctomycetota bacterium]